MKLSLNDIQTLLDARTEIITVDGAAVEREVAGFRVETGRVASVAPPVVRIEGREDPVRPHLAFSAVAVNDWVAVIWVGRLIFIAKVQAL